MEQGWYPKGTLPAQFNRETLAAGILIYREEQPHRCDCSLSQIFSFMLHDADLVAGEFRRTVIDVCSPATLAAVVFYPAKAKNILVLLPVLHLGVPILGTGLVLGLALRLGRLVGSRLLLILGFLRRNGLLLSRPLLRLLTARFCRVGGAALWSQSRSLPLQRGAPPPAGCRAARWSPLL